MGQHVSVPAQTTMDVARLVIDGVDVNACTDDFKLNELLDNCNEYESRKQIRARIKSLLSGNDSSPNAKNGPMTINNQSGRIFGSTVSTKSEVITRRTSVQTTTNRNQSALQIPAVGSISQNDAEVNTHK